MHTVDSWPSSIDCRFNCRCPGPGWPVALSPGRDRSMQRSMISFVARKMRQRRLPVPACLPACVSINTCACVCVCVLKFEHEIEQRGSNGKFTRTAQGQLNQQAREGGGRRVTGLGDGRMIFTCAVDGGRRHRHIFGSACVLSAQLESSRWKALTFPLTASESGSAERSTLRPI